MRNAAFLPWLLLTLAALLPGAGCSTCAGVECGACSSAIFLHVNDEAGDPIAGVTVTGADGGCDDTIGCQIGSSAKTYQLHIAAPGYAPLDVTIDVPAVEETGCCSCGYDQVSKDVTLTKA